MCFFPLSLDDYSSEALFTDQKVDNNSLAFPLLGLFGETGSLLSEVKKKQRDNTSYVGYAEVVLEEVGDVLWYLTLVCSRVGVALSDICSGLKQTEFTFDGAKSADLTFADFQPDVIIKKDEPTPAFEKTLLSLAGQVGLLITDYQSGFDEKSKKPFVERLCVIMQLLVTAATEAGVTLEAAAVKNLAKIGERWPRRREYAPQYDDDKDEFEQLPRKLIINIQEKEVRGHTYVFQHCNGLSVGDRLTDNSATPDDYRFHDVFHYAYAAVLGWSPVMRSLLRLKRKSDPKLDEVEDGARAILIEEGVTTWIFGYAQHLKLFAEIKTGNLSLTMLKQIRQFVSGYEVADRPLWQWEEAILQGYAAFRFLQKHRRGTVTIDMRNHRLTVEELSA